jgi:hypothetical protein
LDEFLVVIHSDNVSSKKVTTFIQTVVSVTLNKKKEALSSRHVPAG